MRRCWFGWSRRLGAERGSGVGGQNFDVGVVVVAAGAGGEFLSFGTGEGGSAAIGFVGGLGVVAGAGAGVAEVGVQVLVALPCRHFGMWCRIGEDCGLRRSSFFKRGFAAKGPKRKGALLSTLGTSTDNLW